MVNSIAQAITSINLLHSKSTCSHIYLQELLEQSQLEHISSTPTKVLIELSLLEEISSVLTNLTQSDIKSKRLLESISNSSSELSKIQESLKILRHELLILQNLFEEEFTAANKILKQIISVHKEFKSRCQNSFLDYLKGVDIDLRKILKPLVPSSVVKEQVKLPMINTSSSLRSSVQSISDSNVENQEEISVKSQPEPSEVTIQKLNTHIQMLVGTLENIAKDLIQVLAEADREYYQLLNKQDVYSRPPTPLAAPLPDYFCYEIQDTPRELQAKQVISNETKDIWIKRLKKLFENQGIKESLYKTLISKLEASTETHKIDLKDIFLTKEISISERESIIYYLINGSTEFAKHVSISEIMSESKLKPEPPKNPKPKYKPFHKIEKEGDKRASPVNTPDLEVARISQGSINPQPRVITSIRLVSKSPKIERMLKNRKSVRVRSITPVGKEKSGKLKAKTPSVQNNKVSLSAFYAKHRLRKNL